ncbi:zf-DHHC-domain-containing protein [Agrocybe pediades]|nr:zf-DHHC-domain-containing protein [Agrocybe pediades]
MNRDSKAKDPNKTCCGVIEESVEAAREKRENRTKAQPWIVRKLMVGVTVGIMGYTAYVYIRHLCLPMIWRRNDAPASRGTGIALLVVFCVLYLWMLVSYFRVVVTSPGFARDYVPKSERPLIPIEAPRDSWPSMAPSRTSGVHDLEAGHRDPLQRPRSFSAPPVKTDSSTSPYGSELQQRENGLAGISYEDLLKRDGVATQNREQEAGVMDSIVPPKPAFMQDSHPRASDNPSGSQLSPVATSATSNTLLSSDKRQKSGSVVKKSKEASVAGTTATTTQDAKKAERERRLQSLNVTRRPPPIAVLQPVQRYCTVDQILKPYRTHHCRACGTCVLKYDHHCPWIGQCVGARNHKFFLNFCQATSVLTSYVLGTLIAYTVIRVRSTSGDLDAQEIVIIALSGLFLLFTFMLLVSHINLTLKGQTTVESMQIRTMKDRERRVLGRGFRWWEVGAKRRKQREWDYEWGRLNQEGNIWWRGNAYEEWVDVMGKNRLGWIFPIGTTGNKGLDYPVNPRFDSEGRWRRRSEWPEHLR